MSDLSASQRAKRYRKALAYLDSCGSFTEEKLRKANQLAGDPLTQADIQHLVRSASQMISTDGKRGGMEGAKDELRASLEEGIAVFGSLGDAGIGEKVGCFGVIAIFAVPAIVYFLC